MRQTISGMVAAVAVMMTMGAAPAMACYSGCAPASGLRRPGTGLRATRLRRLAAAAGPASGCPIRCTSIITSTRARPIPARATGRRVRSIRKPRCLTATPLRLSQPTVSTATAIGAAMSVRLRAMRVRPRLRRLQRASRLRPRVRYGYAPRHGHAPRHGGHHGVHVMRVITATRVRAAPLLLI